MNALIQTDLLARQRWAWEHGASLASDTVYGSAAYYAGMARVDEAIRTLSTSDLDPMDYRIALSALKSLPGDRGAELVLNYLYRADFSVRSSAWEYFTLKRVLRLADAIAERMPPFEPYTALWEQRLKAYRANRHRTGNLDPDPPGGCPPPKSEHPAGDPDSSEFGTVQIARDTLLCVAARNPSPGMFAWLKQYGTIDCEFAQSWAGTYDLQYPADLAAKLTYLTGVWPETLAPWRQVQRSYFVGLDLLHRDRGLYVDDDGKLVAPKPDERMAREIEALRGELEKLEGRFLRGRDGDPWRARLRACGLAAVPMCVAMLEKFPIDRRRGLRVLTHERDDLLFLFDIGLPTESHDRRDPLCDPALAPLFERLGIAGLVSMSTGDRAYSDHPQVYEAVHEYFQEIGAAGHARPHAEFPTGYEYLRRLCDWLFAGNTSSPFQDRDAYKTAKAIDDGRIVPWLLALAEQAAAAREELGQTYSSGNFGSAMTSLTRHVFLPLSRNDHPAIWREWLEARARE